MLTSRMDRRLFLAGAAATLGAAAAEAAHPLRVEAAGTVGTFWDQGGAVFNVKAYGAKGDGATDDTSAVQAAISACASAGGGTVVLPSGTYAVNTGPLPISNGVRIWGYGATITATVSGVANFFKQVLLNASDSIHDVGIFGLTFTGGSSAATTTTGVRAIEIDNSVAQTAANYNITIEDCYFLNCFMGVAHWANNAGPGILAYNMSTRFCRFDNCAYAYVCMGSYGDWVDHCYFVLRAASVAAISTADVGAQGKVPYGLNVAGGIATPGTKQECTIMRLSHINVDGRVADFVNGIDNGIVVAVSNSEFSDIYVANVSAAGLYIYTNGEALNNTVTNLRLWNTGSGLILDSEFDNLFTGGEIIGCHLEQLGQKTNWSPYTVFQYPICLYAGAWRVAYGKVALPSEGLQPGVIPTYGISTVTATGRLDVEEMRFPAFGTGLYNVAGTGVVPLFHACTGVPLAESMVSGNDTTTVRNAQVWFGFSGAMQYPSYIATQHNTTPAGNRIRFYTGDGTPNGVFPNNAILGLSIENGHTCSPQSATAQALTSGGTIATAGPEVQRVAPPAAVAAIILQAGTVAGQRCIVVNEAAAANVVTFAATGSNVADGSGSPIAGLTARSFIWNAGTSLWYRVA